MTTNAIGLINTQVYGDQQAHDEQVTQELAAARGYQFAGVLTITADTYMPTTLIVHTTSSKGATAIVAPSPEHFGPAAHAVALACLLETPTVVVPCTAGRGR
ncbi:hypothetical protein [Nocardia callitridis]|uniref:Uncharacterized protein n=1 Tax=Nocardia callitridis TaxID=648753 RepID=A0ABP9K250_9NOCA